MFWLVIVYNYTTPDISGLKIIILQPTVGDVFITNYILQFYLKFLKNFLTSYVSLECLINSCDSCDTWDHVTRIDFTKNFRSNVLLLWFSVLDKLTQTFSSVTIRLLVVPLVIRCIQSPLWLYIFLLTTALDNLVWRWVILEMTVIFLLRRSLKRYW